MGLHECINPVVALLRDVAGMNDESKIIENLMSEQLRIIQDMRYVLQGSLEGGTPDWAGRVLLCAHDDVSSASNQVKRMIGEAEGTRVSVFLEM